MTLLLEKIDALRERVAALLSEARVSGAAGHFRQAGAQIRQAEMLHNEVANLAAALGAQHEELRT